MSLVERIEQLAKEQGITIKKLEVECGLGNGTIRRWNTKNGPAVGSVEKIAKYLHTTVHYLLTGEPVIASAPELSVGDKAILAQVQHLSENQKLQLSGAISMLVAIQNNPFSQAQNTNDLAAVGLFTGSSSRE